MSDPINASTEPLVYTSAPINGWVAVPAKDLERADGYVVLSKVTSNPHLEEQKKYWHFNLVCIDGANSSVTTNNLGEAIAEYARAVSGWRAKEIVFHERVQEKLSVLSTYTPSA